jgi:hypothetical protein
MNPCIQAVFFLFLYLNLYLSLLNLILSISYKNHAKLKEAT